MPPSVERNNAQRQPITTVLRNVIREYPAGGGVLRELCQNADDAGASTVIFHLDRQRYTTVPLLHEDLLEFQGPALLAYNDREFTDKDFISLSQIGDSLKVNDPASTGKFGRGFNSVYNWTDGPSIISGTSLLLLDPHETWSASPEIGCPGGPLYNFVRHHTDPEIRNQLKPFNTFGVEPDKTFSGTVIRIPLRTPAQASFSKIAPGKAISSSEIEEVFSKFTEELSHTLLFLKNVKKIVLRVDNEVVAQATVFNYILDETSLIASESPGDVNYFYRHILVDGHENSWHASWICKIHLERFGTNSLSEEYEFVVSHAMLYGEGILDDDLKNWSCSFKLFPWAAVAAPLHVPPSHRCGRLFSILPLPIFSKQPFHIHGMFSVTPDRASIHKGEDMVLSASSEANMGARWNKWLVDNVVVDAWVEALCLLRSLNEIGSYNCIGWKFWPTEILDTEITNCCDSELLQRVFVKVVDEELELIPTIANNLKHHVNILYSENHLSDVLQTALAVLDIGVSFPMAYAALHAVRPLGALSSKSIRNALKGPSRDVYRSISPEARMELLRLFIQDGGYQDLRDVALPVLPVVNKGYERFSTHRLMLARDELEDRIFQGTSFLIVDTRNLDDDVLMELRRDVVLNELTRFTGICVWDLKSAARLTQDRLRSANEANKTQDEARKHLEWIEGLWQWLSKPGRVPSAVIRNFSGMAIIPNHGGTYSEITTEQSNLPLNISGRDKVSLWFKEVLKYTPQVGSLYTTNGLSKSTTDGLKVLNLLLHPTVLLELVLWLTNASNREFVDSLGDVARKELVEGIGSLMPCTAHVSELLRTLNIYKQAFSNNEWISLSRSSQQFVGIDTSKFPQAFQCVNVVLVDIKAPEQRLLVDSLNVIRIPTITQLISDYVIPAIEEAIPEGPKKFLPIYGECLKHTRNMNDSLKQQLGRLACVPVISNGSVLHQPAYNLVDPESEVAFLFHPTEARFPVVYPESPIRLSQLQNLGLVNRLSAAILDERVGHFAGTNLDELPALEKKIENLMRMAPPKGADISRLMTRRWIPVRRADGTLALSAPTQCRDRSKRSLLKYALTTTEFHVHVEWEYLLGWNVRPSKAARRAQLEGCLRCEDKNGVQSLVKAGYLDDMLDDIATLPWVLGKSENFFRPEQVVLNGASGLVPYVDNLHVDFGFLKDIIQIDAILSAKKLFHVQAELEKRSPLDDHSLDVAVKLLKEFTKLHLLKEENHRIKAPDTDGRMCNITELTIGTLGQSMDNQYRILHPRVSQETAQNLSIPSVQARYLESLTDPDDFAQEEDTETMINDALKRYPKDTTFTEFLANAEDCGSATQVSWILDTEGGFPTEGLIDPQLSALQGPALYCFNDGVFSDQDFAAIRKVGVGSKRFDKSKLGRFGRGALTMYHWTTTPSFVSGSYFVILDPSRTRLPTELSSRRRRAGMRFCLSDVRRMWPHQLRPFEGIHGFDSETTDYQGTIWRFPSSRSEIRQASIFLEQYTEEARISLLFLKNISQIRFLQRNEDKPDWEVTVKKLRQKQDASSYFCKKRVMFVSEAREIKSSETWCIGTIAMNDKQARRELEHQPSLLEFMEERRLQVRCGVAFYLNKDRHPKGRVFMDLPIRKCSTDLPIMFTADMAIQSNRQSLPIDEKDDGEGARWNRWILSFMAERIYLDVLSSIMQKEGEGGYRHWLQSPGNGPTTIEKVISAAFWNSVATSSKNLYPVIRAGPGPEDLSQNSSITQKNQAYEAKHTLLNSDDVYFDLHSTFSRMDHDYSVVIGLLNAVGGFNIIRPGPRALLGFQKISEAQASKIKRVTPKLLRHVLRTPQLSVKGQTFLRTLTKDPSPTFCDVVNQLLKFVLSDKPDLKELVNCSLIVLSNDSLVSVLASNSVKYLMSPTESHDRGVRLPPKLLNNRPDIVVHQGIAQELRKILLHSGSSCNVKLTCWDDVPRLFLRFHYLSASAKLEMVQNLWEALNSLPVGDLNRLLSNWTIPLLAVRKSQSEEWEFVPWDHFTSHRHGLVLDQMNLDQNANYRRQFASIQSCPGLRIINSSTFPIHSPFGPYTETFRHGQGLYRLLKALDRSPQGIKNAFTYFQSSSDYDHIVTMFLSSDWFSMPKHYVSEFKLMIQKAPIWNVIGPNKTGNWVTSEQLLLSPDYCHGVKWSKVARRGFFLNNSRQLAYEKKLLHLDVPRISVSEFVSQYTIAAQGGVLPASELESYAEFLTQLGGQHSYRSILSDRPILFDGNRRFCLAESLYDHGENTFMAAFRDSELDMFLHPKLRRLSVHIFKLIRQINPHTMLQAALSIEQRVQMISENDLAQRAQLYRDAETVWNSTIHMANQYGSHNPLATLAHLRFIPTDVTQAQSHRRDKMVEIYHQTGGLTTVTDGITSSEVPIAWSQLPVFKVDPAPAVFRGQSRKLSAQTVVDHLCFISEHREDIKDDQVEDCIVDIRESYRYLEKVGITAIDQNIEIWLNVDTSAGVRNVRKADFLRSWTSTTNLVLGLTYDTSTLHQVDDFLLPFRDMLEKAGVKTLKSIQRLSRPPAENPGNLLGKLNEFWRHGTLTDFEIRGNDSGPLQSPLRAHRVVLAVGSEVFKSMMRTSMTEAATGEANFDFTMKVLDAVVTHIYTGEMSPANTDDINDALQYLVDMLHAADYFGITELLAQVEQELCNEMYIRPETVVEVLAAASDHGARGLEEACRKYMEDNCDIIALTEE